MGGKPIYVFMPAYNEEGNVEKVIDELKQLKLDLKIFVIDDGSKDKTAEKAWKAGATVIRHLTNLGGGAALKTAFTVAMLNNLEFIVTLDCDGQHDPKELQRIVEAAENGADLVIGSRFLEKQKMEMPLYRHMGIKIFSWLITNGIKIKISDATSCYRAYSLKMIRKVLSQLRENQYYGLETIMRIVENKAKIVEVPVTSKPRRKGKSKKGVIKYGYNLLRIIIKNSFE